MHLKNLIIFSAFLVAVSLPAFLPTTISAKDECIVDVRVDSDIGNRRLSR